MHTHAKRLDTHITDHVAHVRVLLIIETLKKAQLAPQVRECDCYNGPSLEKTT